MYYLIVEIAKNNLKNQAIKSHPPTYLPKTQLVRITPSTNSLSIYLPSSLFIKKKIFLIFVYLAEPGLSWGMWDLDSWAGAEAKPPALGAQSPSHWTTSKGPLFLPSLFTMYWFYTWMHKHHPHHPPHSLWAGTQIIQSEFDFKEK